MQSSESGKRDAKTDLRERDIIVQEKLAWDENAARKIWCFGCETEVVKVLVKDVLVPQITEMREKSSTGSPTMCGGHSLRGLSVLQLF